MIIGFDLHPENSAVWVTGSPGHHCDPVCDPEFFNFRFLKKCLHAKLTLHFKC
jgi:hypothetical protein